MCLPTLPTWRIASLRAPHRNWSPICPTVQTSCCLNCLFAFAKVKLCTQWSPIPEDAASGSRECLYSLYDTQGSRGFEHWFRGMVRRVRGMVRRVLCLGKYLENVCNCWKKNISNPWWVSQNFSSGPPMSVACMWGGSKSVYPSRNHLYMQKWWRWTWWASYLCRQREDWTMLLGTGRSWCPTTGGMQLGSAARMSWSHTPPLGITHPDYWETKESCSSDALLFSVFFEWILFLKYFSFFPREAHFVGLLFFYRTWREQLCWMKRLHVIFLYLFVYLLFFLVFHVGLMSRSE